IIVSTGKVYFGGGINKFNNTTNSLLFFSKTENIKFYGYKRERYEYEPKITNFYTRGTTRDEYREFVFEGKIIKLKVPEGYHWKYSQEAINRLHEKGLIIWKKSKKPIFRLLEGNKLVDFFYTPYHILDWGKSVSNNWTDVPGFSNPPKTGFATENSEILLKRVIKSTSDEGDLVMDFFLGSGTTTAVAHKLKRKWIGVEMGEHFWTIVLPRMKKVLAYDKSGISKEKDVKEKYNENNAGGFFKYFEIEQFEETLRKVKYACDDPFLMPGEDPYNQYIFMKDLKLLEALEIDYRENKVKVDLSKLYDNIDIAETLSCLLGEMIKKVSKDEVEFEDGTKIDLKNLDYKLIKPLIWWG
ncbi:MAG: site-specific DNA-methyltransferase, partial [Candidatus Aenigmatarchaeota archaeon]